MDSSLRMYQLCIYRNKKINAKYKIRYISTEYRLSHIAMINESYYYHANALNIFVKKIIFKLCINLLIILKRK